MQLLRPFFISVISLWSLQVSLLQAANVDSVEVVDSPDISKANSYYVGNREPLLSSKFIKLPVGSIQPQGWLLTYLERQRDGLAGHLGEISVWLQKEDNAWLSKDGKGKYGWEEMPYWLKGYGDMGYILRDPEIIAETKIWIEGVLASQRTDGDFGPDHRFKNGTRDYWANMIMLFCLESYYDYSNDKRVLDLMTKYFAYQNGLPEDQIFAGYWDKMRGGDSLYSIYWLYNRTGDGFLLELAHKIHRRTANWRMPDKLPNWHNVNIAQGFREPATYYLQTHDPKDLQATYRNLEIIRELYGQVPGGMWGGDENSRPGYSDPRQAVETCGIVEQLFSDEYLLTITGDRFWADHAEDVAFNTYPAALAADMRSLRYLTAPNMVLSDDKNHAPGIQNKGPFLMMNPFSARCCQHNHSQGWPYFSESLWFATPDNGLAASIYAASEVTARVGNGEKVIIQEETKYPFSDKLSFTIKNTIPQEFPLYLRIPAWCQSPVLANNGKEVALDPGKGQYIKIRREWRNQDEVTLQLPMALHMRRWEKNRNSVSIDYGPLTFSLRIEEQYLKVDSTKTAISDSRWQKAADPVKWPSWIILPDSAWNYGLILNTEKPESSFVVKHKEWPKDNFPFTQDSVPVYLEAKAKKIPQWTLDQYGLVAFLPQSPISSDQPEESIQLIPMGAARLRISAFPVVNGETAKK